MPRSYPVKLACETYCQTLEASCDAEADETPDCVELCEADVFYEGSVSGEVGEWGASSGNFLACRLEHAYRASEASEPADQAASCSAAATHGGDVCGSYQDVWCKLGATVCGPDAAMLPDEPTFQLATPWRDGLDACLAMDTSAMTDAEFEAASGDLARARRHASQGDWADFTNCCQEGGTGEDLDCGL